MAPVGDWCWPARLGPDNPPAAIPGGGAAPPGATPCLPGPTGRALLLLMVTEPARLRGFFCARAPCNRGRRPKRERLGGGLYAIIGCAVSPFVSRGAKSPLRCVCNQRCGSALGWWVCCPPERSASPVWQHDQLSPAHWRGFCLGEWNEHADAPHPLALLRPRHNRLY